MSAQLCTLLVSTHCMQTTGEGVLVKPMAVYWFLISMKNTDLSALCGGQGGTHHGGYWCS